jgi:hypothetical protein
LCNGPGGDHIEEGRRRHAGPREKRAALALLAPRVTSLANTLSELYFVPHADTSP